MRTREGIIVSLILVCAAYLGFAGLGQNRFWDDEAQVAFFARNLVRTGSMSGWDGRNLFALNNGGFLDKKLMPRNSPLDFFVCAASFKTLGEGTVQGRLPFVLAGLSALVVFWVICRKAFERSGRDKWYALVLLAFHYSFLLSIRQCRYYALVLLFPLLMYWAYRRLIRRGDWLSTAVLGVSAVALFFSNYLVCAAFGGSLAFMHIVLYRTRTSRAAWIKLGGLGALFAAVAVPFAVVNKVWVRPDAVPGGNSIADRLALLYQNVRELDSTGYLPLLVVCAGIFFAIRARKSGSMPKVVSESALLTAGFIAILSLLSHQNVRWAGYAGGLADIRYFLSVLPFCILLLAWVAGEIDRAYHWVVSAVVCVTLLCTTILSLNVNGSPVRFPLPGLLVEFHRDYQTPYDAAVAFLEKNAVQDDLVYATPEYANYPLMYYLGDKIKIAGIVRRDSHLDSALVASLAPHLHDYNTFPNWFVAFGRHNDRMQKLSYFTRGPYHYGCHQPGNCTPFAVLGTYWKDRTRPELPWHSFGPVKRYNPMGEDIYVYRRE